MGLFSKKTKDDKKDTAKKTDAKVKVADKKAVTKKVVKKSDKKAGEAYRFLLRPIISEKATVGAADGKYTFEVSMDANKVAIKKAVEEVYGVVPTDVNIMNKRGKNVRYGRKYGRTKNIKKAIVTLRKGDSIKLYEGI
ncbi:MAG: 50S ribosomal protein L23 [Candidatus Pacebacteria bacterium]|jgi:large subunit ribosomal protein L23|nr:50S ribosomal protein L23 [Candidatus Paceibacterota bacterium]MBT4652227.1 50S ribosomal protein L23 [Candidatus Paceibacterota bacterium]MBT6755670.1 50S ribosomal protein L23 [Candidatus Paceibacterota bacterium]MBT6920989.1 50S ribosomal protein L23 [Candidatus Paceibacterota bacterium]